MHPLVPIENRLVDSSLRDASSQHRSRCLCAVLRPPLAGAAIMSCLQLQRRTEEEGAALGTCVRSSTTDVQSVRSRRTRLPVGEVVGKYISSGRLSAVSIPFYLGHFERANRLRPFFHTHTHTHTHTHRAGGARVPKSRITDGLRNHGRSWENMQQ